MRCGISDKRPAPCNDESVSRIIRWMGVTEPIQFVGKAATGWRASLELGFERRGERSVLAKKRHDGPLVVQKALYPEGEEVWHAIIVHPPAGIAGGDVLRLDVEAGKGAHALLTTPGAGKWYRSAGPWASLMLAFSVAPGAALEWLPQETILYDGARASLRAEVHLQEGATYIGWEILCLGRTGSGERFEHGECRLHTSVLLDERLIWLERGGFSGNDELLRSPAGFAGCTVAGTMTAVGPVPDDLLAACRGVETPRGAVTRLPGLLVARYLGDSGSEARRYFAALWRLLRPAFSARAGIDPRIWSA